MSTCYTCGFENPDGAEWCGRCGAVLPLKKTPTTPSKFPQDHITQVKDNPPSIKSKWSLFLGILSVLLLLMTGVCAPLSGIFAGILGNQELKRIKLKEYSSLGEYYCQIGIWCGYISSCMSALLLVYLLVAGSWFFKWFQDVINYR